MTAFPTRPRRRPADITTVLRNATTSLTILGWWVGAGVTASVLHRLLGDDPLGDLCEEFALVRLRESFEPHDRDAQLVEIRNVPERDPWRGMTA